MIDELKALRVEVAGLTRERDEARATTEKWLRVVEQLRENLNAALRERDALRAAFMGLRETYGLVLAFAREVLGVLERGEQGHRLTVPDRTIQLLRCNDQIPTADDVLAEARAALASGGDRG